MNKETLVAQAVSWTIKAESLDWDECFLPGLSFNFNLRSMFLSYAFPNVCTLGARRVCVSQRHPSSVEQGFHQI